MFASFLNKNHTVYPLHDHLQTMCLSSHLSTRNVSLFLLVAGTGTHIYVATMYAAMHIHFYPSFLSHRLHRLLWRPALLAKSCSFLFRNTELLKVQISVYCAMYLISLLCVIIRSGNISGTTFKLRMPLCHPGRPLDKFKQHIAAISALTSNRTSHL